MKKAIYLLTAICLSSCEKNSCMTCTETSVTEYHDVIAGTVTSQASVHKFVLCEQSDIDDVNGLVIKVPIIHTAQLQYYRTTITTNCN